MKDIEKEVLKELKTNKEIGLKFSKGWDANDIIDTWKETIKLTKQKTAQAIFNDVRKELDRWLNKEVTHLKCSDWIKLKELEEKYGVK